MRYQLRYQMNSKTRKIIMIVSSPYESGRAQVKYQRKNGAANRNDGIQCIIGVVVALQRLFYAEKCETKKLNRPVKLYSHPFQCPPVCYSLRVSRFRFRLCA